MIRSTTEIKREAPEAVLATLRSESPSASKEAAAKMIADAASYGLGLRDYLRLRIDPRQAEKPELYLASNDNGRDNFLTGYEAALSYLQLPVRDDLEGGVTLQLAADTFQTFPGVRALFPEVIDDMLAWRYRQTNFETINGIVSQSRTVAGTEMLSTVIEDSQADYEDYTRAISEQGRIPIHAIKASQQAVKFWKFGTGYKTSYEFNRRVRLDYLTPFAQRTQQQIERSKVAVATSVLINGDGAYSAAGVINQSSFNDANTTGTATNGKLSWKHLCAWLNDRAKAGVPVDTVLGGWDMYLQWLFMFAVPTTNGASMTDAEQLARAGHQVGGVPILSGNVNFKLSSAVPTGQLIGFAQGYTIEELVEGGSLINESEQSIQTQEVTYVKTENSGFRLSFGDTRSILDVTA